MLVRGLDGGGAGGDTGGGGGRFAHTSAVLKSCSLGCADTRCSLDSLQSVCTSGRPEPLRTQDMQGSPENIPLGECTLSQSRDQLTPTSRTESTVFSLSRSESIWTGEPPDRCEVFWFPIHLMSTGGSFLACGMVISGLYFAGHCRRVTNILGPALLSIGLMVFVVGVVLIPITKENRRRMTVKKPLGHYRPPVYNL